MNEIGGGHDESLYSGNVHLNDCQPKERMDEAISHTIGFTVASSVLSLVGSLLTILPFLLWKDVRRSTIRQILLFLSISDFFTASGYLLGGTAHYHFFLPTGTLDKSLADRFRPLCAVQSFVISFFSTASFFWTTYLAVYFVLVVVFGVYHWNKRLIVLFSITAWTLPLSICSVAVSLKFLGIGETFINAAPGVCFVSSNQTILADMSSKTEFDNGVFHFLVLEAVSMKLWEVIAMVSISGCYLVIFVVNRCRSLKSYRNDPVESPVRSRPLSLSKWSLSASSASAHSYSKSLVVKSVKSVDIKLLLIPVVFVIFRAWGTIRYFVSIWSDCHQYLGPNNSRLFCVTQSCFDILYHPVLLKAQAIFDPLQGFGNAILFVVLSKVIVTRLLSPFRACCKLHQRLRTHSKGYNPQSSDDKNERGTLIENGSSTRSNGMRSVSLADSSVQMTLADYPVINL